MKTTFRMLLITAAISLIFTGCTVQGTQGSNPGVNAGAFAGEENGTQQGKPFVTSELPVDAVSPSPEFLPAGDYGSAGALKDEVLTLEKMLTYAIEDEYAAHSEYEAIINEYGSVNPYSNIIRAESAHINALVTLFRTYGISVPADTGDEHAVIPSDLKAAASVGVQAEQYNISMYEKFLKENLPQDVKDAFISLRDASLSHLAAFQNQL